MSPVRHENATTVGGLLPLYKIRVRHSPSFLLSTAEMVRPPSGGWGLILATGIP